ncbi:energy coupling factor transporter S component ThiW [Ruminiclostridium herbifermentans]|uniref:Energy coupling factor transporter S component ThiW n=1 Tax=Ruminiclostridium herbifermentans TaxID=2488810 RepID=A0A4V6YE68_9FIRM|nr:energy coupling factor transporter S component ThiW [Ruminiclostridium herbifermentans]QNU68427.1 energy coupling factor transporter S component ThiW [Ruminiclostridium herbifermentans]
MKINVKMIALSGLLIAVAVVGSTFSFPVGIAKCAPVQHMVNVIAGVMLGPFYAVVVAFAASCIRVIAGTGTLLAFPGSMVGALLCGLLYRKIPKVMSAVIGEVIGTGLFGAILAYPVAAFILEREAALFGFVIPFSISSFGGAAITAILIFALKRRTSLESIANKL